MGLRKISSAGDDYDGKKKGDTIKLPLFFRNAGRNFFLYGIIIVVAISMIILMFYLSSIKTSTFTSTADNKEKLLAVTNKEPVVKDFISANKDYETNIVILTKSNITTLVNEFSALYGGIKPPEENGFLYQVEYTSKSADEGIFVIVNKDLDIIKYFKVYSIGIGNLQI